MSKKKTKKNSKKSKGKKGKQNKRSLKVHQFSENPVLIVSDKVSSQINFLHQKVEKKEWSGILLYSHKEGSIAEADDLVLVAEEIYPMDIGSSGGTNYKNDTESIINLVDNYPRYEEMELKIGHIHSHHNMGAYFSGTDMSELEDNAPSHNYYLSLIVNFACQPVAKIATICEVEGGRIKHPGAKDTVEKPISKEKRLGVYDVTVTQQMSQRFYDRWSQVKKEHKKRKKSYNNYVNGKKYPRKYHGGRSGYHGINQTQKNWLPRGNNGYGQESYPYNQTRMGFHGVDFDNDDRINEFIYKWLHMQPNVPVIGAEPQDALDYIEYHLLDQQDEEFMGDYIEQVINEFETMAISILGDGMMLTDDEYLKLSKIVVEKLENCSDSELVDELIESLEIYKEMMEENVQDG